MEEQVTRYISVTTWSKRAAGIPTMLLLPITTAFFPLISTLYRCNNSIHPFGVHGTNNGSLPRIASRPMFSGWNPSTSFSMHTAFKMFCSFICWNQRAKKIRIMSVTHLISQIQITDSRSSIKSLWAYSRWVNNSTITTNKHLCWCSACDLNF